MDEKIGLKVSLEEVKSYYREQSGTMDSFKSTARSIFQGSSLVLALIGALQIWNANVLPAYKGLYEIGILLVLLVYLILIVMCVNSLLPSRWWGPINTKYET